MAIENVGVIDSPYITTNSDIFVNLGRMSGKSLNLNAQDSSKFAHGSSVLGADKVTLTSEKTELEESSLMSKKIEVNSKKFEMSSSSVSAGESFLFHGQHLSIKDQSELWAGSDLSVYSDSFSNEYSNIESNEQLKLFLNDKSISFLNSNGRIFAFNLSIFTNGDAHNIAGTIEAMQRMRMHTNLLINAEESLIESGILRICAKNVVNEKSIIRSLLGDIDFELSLKDGQFISNAYVHTTSQSVLTKTSEDKFSSMRNADIHFKYHKPKEEPTSQSETTTESQDADSTGSLGSGNEKKETSAGAIPNEGTENEHAEQETLQGEIGSLLNFSGEIISAGNVRFNGSGSLYNVSDSVIRANNNFWANIFGRLLNKHRSRIEAGEKAEAKTKIGIIYFENSILKSRDSAFSSGDKICFDEASQVTGSGILSLITETLVNRGVIKCNDNINAICGHLDNSGTIESKTDIRVESSKSFRETKDIKRGFSNKGGTIKAVGEVNFLSPTLNIGGDIVAGTLIYKFYQPNSEKE